VAAAAAAGAKRLNAFNERQWEKEHAAAGKSAAGRRPGLVSPKARAREIIELLVQKPGSTPWVNARMRPLLSDLFGGSARGL
jgi:hypothetical protein